MARPLTWGLAAGVAPRGRRAVGEVEGAPCFHLRESAAQEGRELLRGRAPFLSDRVIQADLHGRGRGAVKPTGSDPPLGSGGARSPAFSIVSGRPALSRALGTRVR